MGWFKENKIGICVLYVNLIFILRVMMVCYRIKDFNFILVSLLYFVGISVYWLYKVLLYKAHLRVLFTALVLCTMLGLIYFYRLSIVEYVITRLVGNFNSINNLLYSNQDTYFQLFKPYVVLLLPIITLLLLFLYFRGFTEVILVLNLSVMLTFWYLNYSIEIKTQVFAFITLSVGTYTLNNYSKNIKQMNKAGLKVTIKAKSIIIDIIVFSLLVALVGMFLPQNYTGKYSVEGMEKWTNPFSPDPMESLNKSVEGKYGISTSGYSNTSKKLGGPLTISTALALQVKADKAYYLRGDVKETYTGSSWIKAEENYQNKPNVEDLKVNKYLSGVFSYDKAAKTNITIIPVKLLTNTLFVPNYVSNVILDTGKIYCETNSLTFISSGRVNKEYILEFYDSDKVEELIKDRYVNQDIIFEKRSIQKYLDVPGNISDRTVELVNQIVKSYRKNTEKVDAIRDYLSKNYPYSLNVSEVPEGQEFLDYFLFTEKKGYCTYFATAMTMMCRIAGIPARYVEGFKMPEKSYDGMYDITNEQAHAWSEVLYDQQQDLWVTKDCSATPQEERDRIAREEVSTNIDNTPEGTPSTPETNIIDKEKEIDEQITPSIKISKYNVPYKVAIPISCLLIIILYVLIKLLLFVRLKHKIISSSSSIPMYLYCLKRLKTSGLKKLDNETDKEFVTGIGNKALRDILYILVDKVYDEFYGGLKDDSINKQEIYLALEQYVKVNQNVFEYNFNKYFL